MMAKGSTASLDERLPAEVVLGGSTFWTRYRQYPVFSMRWLAGRSLLFGACISALALVSALGVGFATRDYAGGAQVGLYTFAAFMTMATAGPALACWVRHRRWPAGRERVALVLAVALGIGASFFADRWASGYIERNVLPPGIAAGQQPRPTIAQRAPDKDAVRRRMQTAEPLEFATALTVNIVVLIFIYGLFGGGLALRAYFGEQRRREANAHRRELDRVRDDQRTAELRLGVLQAQVEPHFLFNTLAAVRALVRDRPGRAEDTLDALVAYLRSSIPRLRGDAGSIDTTLGDQLALCTHYLDVMRLRTDGRLGYSVEVAQSLYGVAFPPLLLITLVENAVKHGIEPKPGAGHIQLRAEAVDGRVRMQVLDDGIGLSPGVHVGGLGLANVRGQLQARYGDRAHLSLQGRPGGGTLATIDLPLECA